MQRYFIEKIENGIVKFNDEQSHHLIKVMRMKPGDQITCVIEQKVYLCQIETINPLIVKVVEELEEKHELDVNVTLLYCLPKGDKLDLVIQKATELGVREIILVQSERCIAKIKQEDQQRKLMRFQTIAKEASEQSKRVIIPQINKVIKFKDINKYNFDHQFIAYENEDQLNFYESLLNLKKGDSIGILIGSEGGFSIEEVKYAQENGYRSISLGKRILRSETAVFYSLSAISFMAERK